MNVGYSLSYIKNAQIDIKNNAGDMFHPIITDELEKTVKVED